MTRGAHIISLVVLLLPPSVPSARVLGAAGGGQYAERAIAAAVSGPDAFGSDTSAASRDLRTILPARGRGIGAYGGGMHAGPRFSAGRFGGPGFHRFPSRGFPYRAYRFLPFVGFGFAFPLYVPYYPYYYYPYNPYCDPASSYFYPPWCPY